MKEAQSSPPVASTHPQLSAMWYVGSEKAAKLNVYKANFRIKLQRMYKYKYIPFFMLSIECLHSYKQLLIE